MLMFLRRGGHSYTSAARIVIKACQGRTDQPELRGYSGPVLTEEHLPKNYDGTYAYKDAKAILTAYAESLEKDTRELRAETEEQLWELLGLAMGKARRGDLYGVQVALQVA